MSQLLLARQLLVELKTVLIFAVFGCKRILLSGNKLLYRLSVRHFLFLRCQHSFAYNL